MLLYITDQVNPLYSRTHMWADTTAQDHRPVQEEAKTATPPVEDYILKPLHPHTLLAIIDQNMLIYNFFCI